MPRNEVFSEEKIIVFQQMFTSSILNICLDANTGLRNKTHLKKNYRCRQLSGSTVYIHSCHNS